MPIRKKIRRFLRIPPCYRESDVPTVAKRVQRFGHLIRTYTNPSPAVLSPSREGLSSIMVRLPFAKVKAKGLHEREAYETVDLQALIASTRLRIVTLPAPRDLVDIGAISGSWKISLLRAWGLHKHLTR